MDYKTTKKNTMRIFKLTKVRCWFPIH